MSSASDSSSGGGGGGSDTTVTGVALADGVAVFGDDAIAFLRERRLGCCDAVRDDAVARCLLMPEEAMLATARRWMRVQGGALPRVSAAKMAVFEALWSQGFYVAPALKFGGDYLVYQDPPSAVHASYIVVVREFAERTPVLSLCSSARLASNVNKLFVLASVDESNNVNFITVKWHQAASTKKRSLDNED